jgi:metallophosphoesterase (TIGR00282 family)
MKILFLGDVVGKTGRRLVAQRAAALAREVGADLVVANVENVAAGAGVTPATLAALLHAGVDVATSGNHVFARKESLAAMDEMPALVRPANYPPGAPGRGWRVATTPAGVKVGVVNLVGRVFMDCLDCPFRAADGALAALAGGADVVLVDFHAEATSEKETMGYYLDGRVAAVLGTHTHVPTADERVLPGGTAFITDVGMTGPAGGVIGTKPDAVIRRLVQKLPARFEPAEGKGWLCAVVVDADETTGLARGISRVMERED